MKHITILFASALVLLASCQKDDTNVSNGGVELTISAPLPSNGTKTSYAYNLPSGSEYAGSIAVDWEADESITVVSIGESGITAVNTFTSSGAAGRAVAEFTGTWEGNPGDKVICLYPAISTGRYTGVTVGATSIGVSFPAHSPDQDINSIKPYDLMIGDVTISGSSATVNLDRKIAVLRLKVSGAYKDSDTHLYYEQLGVSATNSEGTPKLFASAGEIATTKATYTGTIVPTDFYSVNRQGVTTVTSEPVYEYVPVMAEGTLDVGDKIFLYRRCADYNRWQQPATYRFNDEAVKVISASSLTMTPGYVYQLNF